MAFDRITYSQNHVTYIEAESVLKRLMAEGVITEEHHPKIVPYTRTQFYERGRIEGRTFFAIDIMRTPVPEKLTREQKDRIFSS